jgi:hypothetical protein
MTERCGTCGFVGEPDTYTPHDCYWVFRERLGYGKMGARATALTAQAPDSPGIDVLKRQQIESPAHPRGESTQSTTPHAIEQQANL